jgi:uncharacterized repeat protein (TIGR01451 family)
MRVRGAVCLVLGLMTPAWAAGPNLEIVVRAQHEVRRTDAKGKQVVALEPLTATHPGETLVYSVEYRNTGDAPAVNAVLATPIPDGTTLVRGTTTAPGGDVHYSIDGKTWSAWPKTRAAGVAGAIAEVDVPPAAVRHMRVQLRDAVPVGGRGSASFKVIVK